MTRTQSLAAAALVAVLSYAALAQALARALPDDAVLFPHPGAAYRLLDGTRVWAVRVDGDAVRHRVVRVAVVEGPREGEKELVARERLVRVRPASFLGLGRAAALALFGALLTSALTVAATAAAQPDPRVPPAT